MARIVIAGAGAVGCYFGVQLQRAGHDVTFLARAQQAKALSSQPLSVVSANGSNEIHIGATADPGVARDAELMLVCVKSHDTAAVAREVGPFLQSGASVVCLQNGVRNDEIFEAETRHPAIPAVVYVAAEMESATRLRVNTPGSVVLGPREGGSEPLRDVVKLFESASIPCRVSDFIARELWEKLIINCAFNGISACTGARYGTIMNSAAARELMEQIIRESVGVANALQIPLEYESVREAAWKVGQIMHAALSSTAQDLQRHKSTEIDFLNGEIVENGKRLGIATPANQAIVALVHLAEANNQTGPDS